MKTKIEFKITTPSKMEVSFDNKILIVRGEITMPPVFYADLRSFKNWEPPFENEEITEKEKEEIIDYITQESLKEGQTKVVFD